MKVGDAVRFIGFPGHRSGNHWGLGLIGIIINVHEVYGQRRYSVSWPDGSLGYWLYEVTLEVISESR